MLSGFDRHQSAMSAELGFMISGGIAAGLSGVGLGLTLTLDTVGKKRTADQREWSMADTPSDKGTPKTETPEAPDPS
jgi:hypothetical protein